MAYVIAWKWDRDQLSVELPGMSTEHSISREEEEGGWKHVGNG